MPAKTFDKIRRQVVRKKGKITGLHENSRDCKRLQRAAAREERIAKQGLQREQKIQPLLSRVTAFYAAVKCGQASGGSGGHESKEAVRAWTMEQIHKLINEFICQKSLELDDLRKSKRPGRPPTSREVHIAHAIEREKQEFESGYWIPDVQSSDNLRAFLKWNGQWGSLVTINFIRVNSSGSTYPSTFPPNGLS